MDDDAGATGAPSTIPLPRNLTGHTIICMGALIDFYEDQLGHESAAQTINELTRHRQLLGKLFAETSGPIHVPSAILTDTIRQFDEAVAHPGATSEMAAALRPTGRRLHSRISDSGGMGRRDEPWR